MSGPAQAQRQRRRQSYLPRPRDILDIDGVDLSIISVTGAIGASITIDGDSISRIDPAEAAP